MCGLCGVFGGDHHWTAAGSGGGAAADPHRRRLDRAHRVGLVNRALSGRRLTLRDWQGASYLLAGPTGQTEIVAAMDDLWQAVERLTGRPYDPLDLPDDG